MFPETQTEGLAAVVKTEPEVLYRAVLESLSEGVVLVGPDFGGRKPASFKRNAYNARRLFSARHGCQAFFPHSS
jgi:hypothetical protein